MSYAMLGGMFESIKTFFMEVFNFIPKIIYLLYASLSCVLDVIQLFFRKIAGLDVYYVDGKPVTGDLVTNFIGGILGFNEFKGEYSALTTVFWAFIVFGVIMVFISTFVAIIKSHYSYDDKAAKGPMQYVYTGGKAIINIIAVPVIVFIGLFLSQAILTALDSMTSITSGSVEVLYGDKTSELQSVENRTGDGDTYIYYDIFGYGSSINYNGGTPDSTDNQRALIGANTQTFSGSMFKVAAFNGNRARTGEYRIGGSAASLTLFQNADNSDELAEMIDTAFACNLHLNNQYALQYGGDAIDNIRYITAFKSTHFRAFSKFNVGLVWYYYDLWQFNFIVGFAACIICAALFINIVMGLITRLFMSLGLFLIAPPLFGLAPIDGGKAGKSWTEKFVQQILMAYGAVVGMNIFFLILPYINTIDFFNIPIADYFAQALIIITGLVTIKAFIAMISGLIGGADATKTGGDIAKEVGTVAGKATKMTMGAAKIAVNPIGAGVRAAKGVVQVGAGTVKNVAGKVSNPFGIRTGINKLRMNSQSKKAGNLNNFDKQNEFIRDIGGKKANFATFAKKGEEKGFSATEINKMWKDFGGRKLEKNGKNFDEKTMATKLKSKDKNFYENSLIYGSGKTYDSASLKTDRAKAINKSQVAETKYEKWSSSKAWGVRDMARGSNNLSKSGIFAPIQNAQTAILGNDVAKGFKDELYPKPDPAKETMKHTGKMAAAMEKIDDKIDHITKKVEEIDKRTRTP